MTLRSLISIGESKVNDQQPRFTPSPGYVDQTKSHCFLAWCSMRTSQQFPVVPAGVWIGMEMWEFLWAHVCLKLEWRTMDWSTCGAGLTFRRSWKVVFAMLVSLYGWNTWVLRAGDVCLYRRIRWSDVRVRTLFFGAGSTNTLSKRIELSRFCWLCWVLLIAETCLPRAVSNSTAWKAWSWG